MGDRIHSQAKAQYEYEADTQEALTLEGRHLIWGSQPAGASF